MFSAQTYVERRKNLIEKVNDGICIFMGNEEAPMNYADNVYRYRQDSTFLYYFGLNYAGLAAIVDVESGEEIVYGNDLTIDDIVWMGTQPTINDKAKSVGIKNTKPLAKFEETIKEALSKGRKVHYLPPYRHDNIIKLHKILGYGFDELKEKASVEFITVVANQRAVKSEEEIVEMDLAAKVSNEMHMESMRVARAGMTEAEVAAALEYVALKNGMNLAYPAILTIHGETLHNHYHGNTLKSGDMVLNDSGAETQRGYAGDLSRTFPVDKDFTNRQREIYQIALNAHEAAIASLKPGYKFMDVHLTACRTLATGLKEMGFMKGDVNEAVAAGAHALFFQCGTGHMMGLDVHDMEDLGEVIVGYDGEPKSTQFGLKSLRLGRELKPGYVITIEPGIYFIPELIDMWKAENKFSEFINYDMVTKYKDFGGLRSEEDFVITETGFKLLGGEIPKTIKDIENVRAQSL